MLSLFSFDTRKRLSEVRSFLRQLVDLTSPNLPPTEGESRAEGRSNRTLPALLAPWDRDQAVVDESTYAVTKNISDRGLSLVLSQPLKSTEVVVGLWLDAPRYVLGQVRQNVPIGGGFWQVGVELTELLDPVGQPQLRRLDALAARLVPNAQSAAT